METKEKAVAPAASEASAPAASILMSPPLEDWDKDGDFDFSENDEETGERSSSLLGRSVGLLDDERAPASSSLARGEEGDFTWDADFGDEDVDGVVDEDQVETIKLSSVAGSTLAQLAQLSAAKRNAHAESPNADGLSEFAGTVTQLGRSNFANSKLAPRVDTEGGGDWDEDLEIPDVFPNRLLRRPASFASDIETGTPSLGSTIGSMSEGTSQGTRSDSLGLTDPEGMPSSHAGPSTPSKKEAYSSSTSSNASSLMSPPRTGHFPVSITSKSPGHPDWEGQGGDEADFVLAPEVQRLSLSPAMIKKPTDRPLDQQQRILWDSGDEAKSLAVNRRIGASSPSASGASTDAEEGALEGEDMLDGLEFPDHIFGESDRGKGKTADTALAVSARLEALLDARRGKGFVQNQDRHLKPDTSDHDIAAGLVITDDMDLSPSRLKAKSLRYKLRQQARQTSPQSAPSPSIPTAPRAMLKGMGRPTPPRAPSAYSHGGGHAQGTSARAMKSHDETRANSAARRPISPAVERKAPVSTNVGRSVSNVQERSSSAPRGAKPSPPSVRSSMPVRAPSRADSIDGSSIAPARPSTPSSFQQEGAGAKRRAPAGHSSAKRYTMPTNASRAKQSLTDSPTISSLGDLSVQPMATPTLMRLPKRARPYGDGRELDSFDDLPTTNLDRPYGSSSSRSTGAATSANDPGQKQLQSPFADTSATAASGREQSTTPSDGTASVANNNTRPGRNRRSSRKKQKQPYLIRNLAGASMGPRIVGDMRWNPSRQQWEGNEREMKDFDNALQSSARPALITQLSPLSASTIMQGTITQSLWSGQSDQQTPQRPMALGTRVLSKSSPQSADGQSPGGVRIVGDMVFDPIQLKWTHKSGIEEPDPFAEEEEEEEESRGVAQTAGYKALEDDRLEIYSNDDDAPFLRESSFPIETASNWARRTRSTEQLGRTRGSERSSVAPASSQFGRVTSATIPPATSSASPPRKSSQWQSLTDQTYQLFGEALSPEAGEFKDKKEVVPGLLKTRGVSDKLWKECIAAEERHRAEMHGFLPPVTQSSASSGPAGGGRGGRGEKGGGRAVVAKGMGGAGGTRTKNDSLYLLQRMARQAGR